MCFKEWRHEPNYPMDYIVGDPSSGIQSISLRRDNLALFSYVDLINMNETLLEESYIHAM